MEYRLESDTKLKLEFSYRFTSQRFETSIKQKVAFTIENSKEELPFIDLLNSLGYFQEFLTIATQTHSHFNSITAENDSIKYNIKGKEYFKAIKVFFTSSIPPNIHHSRDSGNFLFYYKDIEENFEEVIRRWYSNKELLNPVSNQIFYYLSTKKFGENRFLDIIQALEAFHRRFRSNEVLFKEEHRKKIEEILNAVNEKHKGWLKERLNFSNEPRLHKRLEELIEEFLNITIKRLIPDIQSFIRDVKNSRNYYTHFSLELKKKALTGGQLFYLTEKIKTILICAILYEAGIKKEQIENFLERNPYYSFLNVITEKSSSSQ